MCQQRIHYCVLFVMLSLFATLKNTFLGNLYRFVLSYIYSSLRLIQMNNQWSKYYIKKYNTPIYNFMRQDTDVSIDNYIRCIGSTTLFLFLRFFLLVIKHSTRNIIHLIMLQKIIVVISGASVDFSSINDPKGLIWNGTDLSFIPTGTIISTSTINIFFFENLNGICVNKTYWGPNPRFSIGPFTTILDTSSSDSELVDDHTLCQKILDQPDPIIIYDADDISSPSTE